MDTVELGVLEYEEEEGVYVLGGGLGGEEELQEYQLFGKNEGSVFGTLSEIDDLATSFAKSIFFSVEMEKLWPVHSLDQLIKARNLSMLKLSPEDEVEGELIYYQQRLLSNTVTKKRLRDDVTLKVVRSLPQELDVVGNQKGDVVLVCQYTHKLRETKKQDRKEHRHREAQAILAAATAAAVASSRISSFRKDTLSSSHSLCIVICYQCSWRWKQLSQEDKSILSSE